MSNKNAIEDNPYGDLRLNYTNCDDRDIEKGIRILGDILKKILN